MLVCATVTGLTLLNVCGGSLDELEGDEFESTLLEAGDDITNQTSLYAVGLRTKRDDRNGPRGQWVCK